MSVTSLRIRELRRRGGYTQKQLADMLELSPSAIGMYEQGRREPDHSVLIRLCETFNVTADWLIGRDPEAPEASETKLAVSDFVSDIRRKLEEHRGLMFSAEADGSERILTDDDLEMLCEAIELGVQLSTSRAKRRAKGDVANE